MYIHKICMMDREDQLGEVCMNSSVPLMQSVYSTNKTTMYSNYNTILPLLTYRFQKVYETQQTIYTICVCYSCLRNNHILSIQAGFTMQEQIIRRGEVQLWPGRLDKNSRTNLSVTVRLGHVVTRLYIKDRKEGGGV